MKTKVINSCMWWGAITVLTLLTHAQAGVVNGTFDTVGTVETDITGWTQIPPTGFGGQPTAYDWVWSERGTHGGVAMSDDGDNWGGGLEQTVTVVAGQPYYLSFDYDFPSGVNVDNGALTYSVVENGDFLLGPTAVVDDTPFDVWQTFGGSFVPTGNQVTLRFMNSYAEDAFPEGASGADQAFDNVTLVMVPEPSGTAALASLMLIGLAGFRARRGTV